MMSKHNNYEIKYKRMLFKLTDLMYMRADNLWRKPFVNKRLLLWIPPHFLREYFIEMLNNVGFDVTVAYSANEMECTQLLDSLKEEEFDIIVDQDGATESKLNAKTGKIFIDADWIKEKDGIVKLSDWQFLRPYLHGNAAAQCILVGLVKSTGLDFTGKKFTIQGSSKEADALHRVLSAFAAATYSLTSSCLSKLTQSIEEARILSTNEILKESYGIIITREDDTIDLALEQCRQDAIIVNVEGYRAEQRLKNKLKVCADKHPLLCCLSHYTYNGKSVFLYDDGANIKYSCYSSMPNDGVDATCAAIFLALERFLEIDGQGIHDADEFLSRMVLLDR